MSPGILDEFMATSSQQDKIRSLIMKIWKPKSVLRSKRVMIWKWPEGQTNSSSGAQAGSWEGHSEDQGKDVWTLWADSPVLTWPRPRRSWRARGRDAPEEPLHRARLHHGEAGGAEATLYYLVTSLNPDKLAPHVILKKHTMLKRGKSLSLR